MASTFLEQTRSAHEECERLERLIVRDFRSDAKGHAERLAQGHRVRKMLDQIQAQTEKLTRIYADDDGVRKEEIAALRGENMYSAFYERLKDVRDYHRRYPYLEVSETEADESALREPVPVVFSGEEGGGRYMDLHTHFHRFVNAKFGRQMDYTAFVAELPGTQDVPRALTLGQPYREYLAGLLEYLESFYQRSQPLASLGKVYAKLESFEEDWAAGRVPGWEDRGEGPAAAGATPAIDLEAFEAVEELETLGADRLKEALAALGLKTGGTLRQRAERLWLTRGAPLEVLDKKHFAKGAAPAAARTPEQTERQVAAAKQAALLEAKVAALREALGSVVEDTVGNVEKKQARTYEELQAEQAEADEAGPLSDSEDEDEYIYNPLKLPLGWDGKPIPYWLYKLHGLNQEFKCEICGNASYWGRRAFERHFKACHALCCGMEWRHQNGMRALGIPNNKNFFEVTQIKDALELWSSIQEREVGGFKAEVEEEFEDESGNVYNRKTYELLKRQGLL